MRAMSPHGPAPSRSLLIGACAAGLLACAPGGASAAPGSAVMPAGHVPRGLAAENLPLRFYQNAPVPGQAIFRRKEGYGRGVPWSLPWANEVQYDIEDYPVTLEVLEATRCIGRSGSSGPWYFRNQKTMDLYLEGFRKVWENLDELAAYAVGMDYQPPWSILAPSTVGTWVEVSPSR